MSNESIRAFIAFELNSETKNALKDIQKHLEESEAHIKWVKPENIHLTIKFLGNISVNQIDNIKNILHGVLDHEPSWSISIIEVGAFPRIENPKVIWAGLEQGREPIIRIAKSIDDRLKEIGFEKEKRPFQAHITLGRVRSPANKFPLIHNLKKYRLNQTIKQSITRVNLIKSTLTPRGPIYDILYSVLCLSN